MAMQRYYRLRVVRAAAGKKDEAGAMLAKEVLKLGAAAAAAAPPPAAPPPAASGSPLRAGRRRRSSSGAGCAEANGREVLQGTYQQAPRWAHRRQPSLIRYRLPSGTNWCGTPTRISSTSTTATCTAYAVPIAMPPSTGWSLAKDGRPPMPSFEFVYDRLVPPPSPEQPRRSFFGQLFGRRQSSANVEASSSASSELLPSAEVQQLIDMGLHAIESRVRSAAPTTTRLGLNILLDLRLPPRRRRRRSRSRRRRRRRRGGRQDGGGGV